MQVSVESIGGLQKRITVQVPSKEIEDEVTSRLKSLVSKVKIDGFRPGRVPYKVVQQRYDGQVRQEVLESVIQKTFYQALSQEKLRPAGGPDIKPQNVHPGQNFEYSATFEVYPEIELAPLDGLNLEKTVVEIQPADVDKMMEKLRVQQVTWQEVDRGGQEEDQLTLNFVGKIDGQPFEGGKAESHPIVLGSQTMIKGFEEQLIGMKKEEKKSIEVPFPEDYWKAELAGKPAVFDVEVIKVAEPILPDLDDEFAKKLGVSEGGIEALREDVKKNMALELDKKLHAINKEAVMNLLLEQNQIELPESLVKQEIQTIKQQSHAHHHHDHDHNHDHDHDHDHKVDDATIEQARKRVTLGILVGEVISKNDISVNSESCQKRVDDILQNIASSYDEPQKLIDAYKNSQEMMEKIRSLALEEEVVDFLMTSMNVTEKSVSFDEVMDS